MVEVEGALLVLQALFHGAGAAVGASHAERQVAGRRTGRGPGEGPERQRHQGGISSVTATTRRCGDGVERDMRTPEIKKKDRSF
ncbi:hypothetical protein GCM10023238_23710 [Streptomyces heliomycini]